MKMQQLLQSIIITSLFFSGMASRGAEDPALAVIKSYSQANEPPTFDISFPGGTLTEFVAHVNKAIEAHVRNPTKANLIFPPEAASLKVPKLELRAVNVQTLMSAVSFLLPSSEYIWQSSGPSTYVLVPRKDPRETRVFFVGNLLKKFKIEDVTTALETVWQMSSKTKADLKYHQDTQLLIVQADRAQLDMTTAVLMQLREALDFHLSAERTQDTAKPNPLKP